MKLPTIVLENFGRYFQSTRMQIDGLTVFRRKSDTGMPLKNIPYQLTVMESVGVASAELEQALGDEHSLIKLRHDFVKGLRPA